MLKDVREAADCDGCERNGALRCLSWNVCFRSVEVAGNRDAAARDMARVD